MGKLLRRICRKLGEFKMRVYLHSQKFAHFTVYCVMLDNSKTKKEVFRSDHKKFAQKQLIEWSEFLGCNNGG